MSAALGLYRLQLVDSQIDVIHKRLDEIHQALEDDEELRQAKARLAEAKAKHKLALQAVNKAEQDVENQKIKIERTEASLYSGTVKNPKELQDLQNESAALKRYLSTLEDRQLDAMLSEESADHSKEEANTALEKVKKQLTDQNQSLSQEKEQLTRDMERLEAERQAALEPLDKELLSSYNQLRQQQRGLAVADLQDGACAACGTTLTPAQLQDARSGSKIYHCPTCGRILYAN